MRRSVSKSTWYRPERCRLLTAATCSGLGSAPDCRTRRALLHLSYSCASPFGPATLVTHDPKRKLASHSDAYFPGLRQGVGGNIFCDRVVAANTRRLSHPEAGHTGNSVLTKILFQPCSPEINQPNEEETEHACYSGYRAGVPISRTLHL